MKKVCLLLLPLFLSFFSIAQDEMEKEFARLTKNTTGVPYGNNKATGKYYNIRGFKMYAETYGQGKPLLIIHGNGGSIGNFVHNLPYFSKKYKVIVADSRAQGNSKDPADSLSYEMMADDYAALLDAMKIDSAYVIGWSDGGINGLLLAMRHPEKVKKLAITGANLWPDTTAIFSDIAEMLQPAYTALKNKADKNAQEKAGWKLMRLLVEEPHITTDDLKTIQVPTLVIGGDQDIIRPAHTLLIAQNIPQSYLWILPNSGHSTPIIYKDEFNKTIDNFFSKPYRKLTGISRAF
ncbi:alpha/beta fold hydrolase [Flavisolibacter tropicus]|uniref:Alpha/beta hydrolase n=1 Tax=Flavisolibacter tropicus TaxID=1492898 RepID=A0A172TTF9_9BACT|nr:alpha/beta hydrolase [Flavisolibacter tropicus]ANE50282.1 alpha/beta hydrolase [Flavisolibacter tropicus]